jgi:hypothetical protein
MSSAGHRVRHIAASLPMILLLHVFRFHRSQQARGTESLAEWLRAIVSLVSGWSVVRIGERCSPTGTCKVHRAGDGPSPL